ncbi:efflux RND transporter periplasmic adaptor subunit [Prolixibacteraceae bacterium]|nr:efflux RND transporter periplasmic adaptor subunit [Prolixibacteraceae bacterium]
MIKRKVLVTTIGIIILLVFSVVFQAIIAGDKEEKKEAKVEENIRYVHAIPVTYQELNSPITSQGRVLSKNIVALSAEASGKLMSGRIALKKGARFKKSDKLYQVYDKEDQLALRASKSEFLTIVARMLPDIKIDFPDTYGTFQEFFNKISLDEDLPEIPKKDINSSSKFKTFLATRNFLNTYYRIKQNELRLKRFSSYAPFDGTFISVNVEVGTFVNPGQQIAMMVDNSRLEIEVPLETQYIRWVKKEMEVSIQTELGENIGKGRVSRISPFVDPGTQSLSVFVGVNRREMPNLYYGQYVRVIYKDFTVKNVMRLPRNSIFNHNKVFIVKDDLLVKKDIVIRKIEDKDILVSGLDEGALVVDEPLVDARENSKVKILNDPAK